MSPSSIPPIFGQWVGEYIYGSKYGPTVQGQKIQFRLFINENKDDQFVGTSVDFDGFEANFETAEIAGFIDGTSISFTKKYKDSLWIDEKGTASIDNSVPLPNIYYTGEYNFSQGKYEGQFEVECNEQPYGNGYFVDIYSGSWEAKKDITI